MTALGFLTPLGVARTPSPRALPWFAAVGALVGLGVGGAWWAGTEVWNPAVGASLAIVADLGLTGMLHIDGLGDSADGLLPHLPRPRRLEVMAQPDVGAFGVAVIAATLLLRFAVLASMEPRVGLVVAVWAGTRSMAAVTLSRGTYARPGGLAEVFRGRSAGAIAVCLAAGGALGVLEPAAAGAAIIAFVLVQALAARRIGGYTGDVLGAAGVVAETAGLLVAAARW